MTISSSEAPAGDKSRFTLWPLPDLRLSADRTVTLQEADGDPDQSEYERGYADGHADGRREAEQGIGEGIRALATARRQMIETQRRHAGENERMIHALAVAIAEQIIQREIAMDQTIVRELVTRAVQDVGDEDAVTVRMHPEDLNLISGDPAWASAEVPSIQWDPDERITRGGCVVESPKRIVDGRIEAALKELFQRLNDV